MNGMDHHQGRMNGVRVPSHVMPGTFFVHGWCLSPLSPPRSVVKLCHAHVHIMLLDFFHMVDEYTPLKSKTPEDGLPFRCGNEEHVDAKQLTNVVMLAHHKTYLPEAKQPESDDRAADTFNKNVARLDDGPF
jgi:hypothetical protein